MKHEKLDLDGDWIPNEGSIPVDGATLVEVKQVKGDTYIAPAKDISWSGQFIKPANQIAAYRVLSPDPKVADADGWITHTPGNPMPVTGWVLVDAKRRDGEILRVQRADTREWGEMPSKRYEIIAYRVAVSGSISDGWIPHTPGEPMPVAGEVMVEAKRRDGGILPVVNAEEWEWGKLPSNEGAEIIAYKIRESRQPEGPKKFGTESVNFDGIGEYCANFDSTGEYGVNHPMYRGFMDAIDQATGGKGQRHGGGVTPFLEQRWHNISKSTGFRGLVYQAVKKAEEATEKPDYESFERELLGAMVYLNMALIHVREHGYTTEVKVDADRP